MDDYDVVREHVETLAARHASWPQIEQTIAGAELDTDAKDALRMGAWTRSSERRRSTILRLPAPA